jgi:SAM-dependent methyltransferase
MSSEFPRDEAFDEDYLYFYEGMLTPERTAAEVELVWKLLELEPGLELLDLACGHGRIANPLAERGVRVTGLDATPLFLELARKDAAERGVEVEYVEGDMRCLGRSGSTACCAGSRRSATSATTRTDTCWARPFGRCGLAACSRSR